jgi:rubredoxin
MKKQPAIPPCPVCKTAKQSKPIGTIGDVYKCGRCGGLYDIDPEEGGDFDSRNPAARLERREFMDQYNREFRRARRRRDLD